MNNDKIKIVSLLVVFYGIFNGIIYLLAFWSTFSINFFNFIGINQVIQYSIYYTSITALLVITGALLGAFYNSPQSKSQNKNTTQISKLCNIKNFFYIKILLNNSDFLVLLSLYTFMLLYGTEYYNKWNYIVFTMYISILIYTKTKLLEAEYLALMQKYFFAFFILYHCRFFASLTQKERH